MQIGFGLDLEVLSHKSPLNYPGGKRRTWNHFKKVFPKDEKILVSPFAGGCGVELICAANGTKVIAADKYEVLINFWQQYQINSDQLIEAAIKLLPLSYEEKLVFYENQLVPQCKDLYGNILTNFDRAVYFFLINRQSFRGLSLMQKPMHVWNKRDANAALFKKFKGWYNPNITFIHNDYRNILDQYEGHLMYFDPPYIDTEYVYGTKDDKNIKFDHKEFRNRIVNLNNRWILSYRKHELVMDLYKDFNIYEYNFSHAHGSKGAKDVTELFILNWK